MINSEDVNWKQRVNSASIFTYETGEMDSWTDCTPFHEGVILIDAVMAIAKLCKQIKRSSTHSDGRFTWPHFPDRPLLVQANVFGEFDDLATLWWSKINTVIIEPGKAEPTSASVGESSPPLALSTFMTWSAKKISTLSWHLTTSQS